MPYNFSMVSDSPEVTSPNTDQSVMSFRRQFGAMVEALGKHDVRIWVLLQVPSSSESEVARDFYLSYRYPLINGAHRVWDLPRSHYERSRARTVSLISEFKEEVIIVDPIEAFFDGSDRLRLSAERALYRDEDHLTRAGAEFYLREVFQGLFGGVSLQARE